DTRSGAILGTPSYMSPEQASAQKNLSTATDVYSLGAILYELLCGRPPFVTSSHTETLLQVLEREPVRPRQLNPKVDRDLETICLTCLAKQPSRRYPSADALAKDLDRYLASEPIRARPVGPWERMVKWIRRRPALAALVAVTLLAGLSLTVLGWWYSAHLKQALTEAERAQHEAQEKSDLLLSNYHKRLDVVDDILNRIDGRLAHMDSTGRLRLEVLGEARRWSQQILQELPSDPVAQTQLARICRSIGDVYSSYHEYRDAALWYDRALPAQEALALRFPDEPTYQNDLAMTSASQARTLAHTNKLPLARQACRRAITLEDNLAKHLAQQPDYPRRAARYAYQLGTLLEDADQAKEAESAYRDALDRERRLLKRWAEKPAYLAELATISGRLGFLLGETDAAKARKYLDGMIEARRAALQQAPQNTSYGQALQQSYADVADWYRRHGRHAELARLAEEYRQDFPVAGDATYNVACFYANAAEAAQGPRGAPTAARLKLVRQYGDDAMTWLRRAVQEGYTDRVHMDVDRDLEPLRGRPDFQKLRATLEQRHPLAPAREYEELVKEFGLARAEHNRQSQAAHTTAQKAALRARSLPFDDFAPRFLALAEKSRDAITTVRALLWVVYRGENNSNDDDTPRTPLPTSSRSEQLVRQAVDELARDHLKGPEFGTVCQALIDSPRAETDTLLRQAAAQHPQTEIRGLATYALALSLASQAQQLQHSNSSRADSCSAEAEQQLQRLIKDYAGVTHGSSTLGETAKNKLYELQHLTVGRPAPEIVGKDLNGQPLKLSDYRGKVVLVDFWANWCGFCRQMYPHEKELVQRMKGRPFVMLGVNCDDNASLARQAVAQEGLTWNSWADGSRGPINDRWQIDGYPTIFVLDGKGIIRHKFTSAPDNAELDAAVDEAVKAEEVPGRGSTPRQ
ncbi:MAG TPA: redoxin domain-containing protein, partial [Gemmataceae bacterium]|nr:redoxin domain-containing protein [Gemmataceae bacterium]